MPKLVSAGISSVVSDNVTIQGTGSAASKIAIKAVQVDGVTITGTGAVGSPLVAGGGAVVGWPLPFWAPNVPGNESELPFALGPNTLDIWGIYIPAAVTFNNITIKVLAADNSHNYDLGFYTKAGALVAHIGAQGLPASGIKTFAVVGGPITLQPGLYYYASTGQAVTGTYAYITTEAYWCFVTAQNVGASSGGALPSTFTPPADSLQQGVGPFFALTL